MAAKPTEIPSPIAEIDQGPGAFEQFLDRHQKAVAALTVLIVLAFLALVIHHSIRDKREENAGAALVKASDATALQKVISDRPGTSAAGTASVLLADKQWTDGRQDDAIKTLRTFLSGNPEHPAVPAARMNLASKLAGQGKADEAAKLFREAAGDPASAYIAPLAWISLGDLAHAANKPDEAEEHYKKALSGEFTGSPFNSIATERAAGLRAKAPVEIDPPPAPKETPGEPKLQPTPVPGIPAGTMPQIPGLQIEEVPSDDISSSQTGEPK